MKEIPTVVTIACDRDLALLQLQAQSICKYLDRINPVCIVINEDNPEICQRYIHDELGEYYKNHALTVLTRDQVIDHVQVFSPHQKNPWGLGWQIQQVLKLAVSYQLSSNAYLVLDCQNFLIKPWSACFLGDRLPYRRGFFAMPKQAYYNYAASVELDQLPDLTDNHYMSMCTPFYMHTGMVMSLIEHFDGLDNFAFNFNRISRIKSEFMLYAAWLEKHGGIEKYHEQTHDFGHPMLRDSRTDFDKKFLQFLFSIGTHETHAWVSVNHRSWGDMSDEQYQVLCKKLSNYDLHPDFEKYRENYVDYVL